MATKVVQRDPDACLEGIIRVLEDQGYILFSATTERGSVAALYEGPQSSEMLYKPGVRVDVERLAANTAVVAVSHLVPRARLAWRLTCLAMLGLAPTGAIPVFLLVTIPLNPWIFGAWLLASFAWAAYWCILKGQVRLKAAVKYADTTEDLIWEQLDPGHTASHEIATFWPEYRSFWRWTKRVSLALLGLVLALLLIDLLRLEFSRGTRSSEPSLLSTALEASKRRAMIGLALVVAAGAALSGLFDASLSLPHRYQWKFRFAECCVSWCIVVAIPSLLLIVHVPNDDAGFFRTVGTLVVLISQGLFLAIALRLVPDFKIAGAYLATPSVTYESLSGSRAGALTARARRRFKTWVWATFAAFSACSYASALYVFTVGTTSVASLLQGPPLSGLSTIWPDLLPLKGRSAAVQALALAGLMGTPLVITWLQAVRSVLRRRRRLAMAQQFVNPEILLPAQPLEYLARELGVRSIPVALIPTMDISARLESHGLVKRRFLLWLSVGALRLLSTVELEAALWHECGHIGLIKRSRWRGLVAVAAPWMARLLDLAEDLYDEEHSADLFATQRMGTTGPLASALRKMKVQVERRPTILAHKDITRAPWATTEGIHAVWDPAWAGYLYPEVEQRIRWLDRGGSAR